MYNYNYGYGYNPSELTSSLSSTASAGIWVIISLVLAIVGAFVVYFIFVKPDKKYGKAFVNLLRRLLNFQEMLIEPILKIFYIFLALFITLSSFALISSSFIGFLFMLIGGNLLVRVIYEFSMILIGIWQNTRDINQKTK